MFQIEQTTHHVPTVNYTRLRLIRHKATVIALAEAKDKTLHYALLDLDRQAELEAQTDHQPLPDAEVSEQFWNESRYWTAFKPLPMPEEERLLGAGILTYRASDIVRSVSPAAAMYWSVISDGPHLYLFRSIQEANDGAFVIYANRYVLSEGTAPKRSEPKKSTEEQPPEPVPELHCAYEARFRASGLADLPANNKDSIGLVGTDGAPFVEPILNLGIHLSPLDGFFSVCLTPPTPSGGSHWQFVISGHDPVHTQSAPWFECISFGRADTGWLDTRSPRKDQFKAQVKWKEGAPAKNKSAYLRFAGQPDCLLFQPQIEADGTQEPPLRVPAPPRLFLAANMGFYEVNKSASSNTGTVAFDMPLRNYGDGSVDVPMKNGQTNTYVLELPKVELGKQVTDAGAKDSLSSSNLGWLSWMPKNGNVQLLESADGHVHLYVNDAGVTDKPNLVAAAFDTRLTIPLWEIPVTYGTLPWPNAKPEEHDALLLFPKRPPYWKLPSPPGSGDDEFIQVKVKNGYAIRLGGIAGADRIELWEGLPYNLAHIATILNGGASEDPLDPRVRNGEVPFYRYKPHKEVWLDGNEPGSAIKLPALALLHDPDGVLEIEAANLSGVASGAMKLTVTLSVVGKGWKIAIDFNRLPNNADAIVDILSGKGVAADQSGKPYDYASDVTVRDPAQSGANAEIAVYRLETDGGHLLIALPHYYDFSWYSKIKNRGNISIVNIFSAKDSSKKIDKVQHKVEVPSADPRNIKSHINLAKSNPLVCLFASGGDLKPKESAKLAKDNKITTKASISFADPGKNPNPPRCFVPLSAFLLPHAFQKQALLKAQNKTQGDAGLTIMKYGGANFQPVQGSVPDSPGSQVCTVRARVVDSTKKTDKPNFGKGKIVTRGGVKGKGAVEVGTWQNPDAKFYLDPKTTSTLKANLTASQPAPGGEGDLTLEGWANINPKYKRGGADAISQTNHLIDANDGSSSYSLYTTTYPGLAGQVISTFGKQSVAASLPDHAGTRKWAHLAATWRNTSVLKFDGTQSATAIGERRNIDLGESIWFDIRFRWDDPKGSSTEQVLFQQSFRGGNSDQDISLKLSIKKFSSSSKVSVPVLEFEDKPAAAATTKTTQKKDKEEDKKEKKEIKEKIEKITSTSKNVFGTTNKPASDAYYLVLSYQSSLEKDAHEIPINYRALDPNYPNVWFTGGIGLYVTNASEMDFPDNLIQLLLNPDENLMRQKYFGFSQIIKDALGDNANKLPFTIAYAHGRGFQYKDDGASLSLSVQPVDRNDRNLPATSYKEIAYFCELDQITFLQGTQDLDNHEDDVLVVGRNFSGEIASIRFWIGDEGQTVQPPWHVSDADFPLQKFGASGFEYVDPDIRKIGTPAPSISFSFAEGGGLIAEDRSGEFRLDLSSEDMWAKSDLNAEGTLYCNGKALQQSRDITGMSGQVAKNVLEIGRGMEDALIQEIRVWARAKSQQEIIDGMFVRASGNETGLALLAHLDEKTDAAKLVILPGDGKKEHGFLGLDPSFSPKWTGGALGGTYRDASRIGFNDPDTSKGYGDLALPLGAESPIVAWQSGKGPYTGAQAIGTGIAAAEYGEVQYDASGNVTGTLKRCYGQLVTHGTGASATISLELVSGLAIGELDLRYITQVQTRPELVGFIEGAPPVPSENLTVPYYDNPRGYQSYAGTTSVTLKDTQKAVRSYSYDDDQSTNYALSMAGGPTFSKGAGVCIGLGASVKTDIFKYDVKVGGHANIDTNFGMVNGAAANVSSGRTLSDRVQARGDWVEDAKTGKRYQPENTGYALIVSEVANLYAMSLRGRGTLIGMQIVPDAGIEPDVNLVMFPINPFYTRQGCLDGYIGQTSYPELLTIGAADASYFRPSEAQEIEARIKQQEASLDARYRQFASGRLAPIVGTPLEYGPAEREAWAKSRARRNLVNTYVWTATGGLHSESEDVLFARTESFGKRFQVSGSLKASLETEFDPGIFIEGAMSGGLTMSRSLGKSREESDGFAVSADVIGESFLRQWIEAEHDAQGKVTKPGSYKHGTDQPGKVTAYRFKTFYLSPDEGNFDVLYDRVIDPDWLFGSASNEAALLRSTRGLRNRLWRVMHRVTYVSRVGPEPDTVIDKEEADAAPVLAMDGNSEFIALVAAQMKKDEAKASKLSRNSRVLEATRAVYSANYAPLLTGKNLTDLEKAEILARAAQYAAALDPALLKLSPEAST